MIKIIKMKILLFLLLVIYFIFKTPKKIINMIIKKVVKFDINILIVIHMYTTQYHMILLMENYLITILKIIYLKINN